MLNSELNQKANSPQAPRAPPPTREAPQKPAAAPVVLPSADEVSRVRAASKDKQQTAAQPVEWKGVSALAGLDVNVANLSLSPQAGRLPAKKADPAPAVQPQPALGAIPTLLPSAEIKRAAKELKDAAPPLEPRRDWGGVSSQVADDYNHAAPDSPEVGRPPAAPAEPAPVDEPDHANGSHNTTAVGVRAYEAPAARRPPRDIGAAQMPLASYGGIASELEGEYNTMPSPERVRRGRGASKEIQPDAVPEAYPVTTAATVSAEPEEVGQYAYDIAAFKVRPSHSLAAGPTRLEPRQSQTASRRVTFP